MEFDSDDPDFTRGFEAGRVYEALLPHTRASLEVQIHSSNYEMMTRIGVATGYKVVVQDASDPSWMVLQFIWT